MTRKSIDVLSDYSRFPAGRLISDGRFSGERFRKEYLVPALKTADRVEVRLDGPLGYGSSFLEEAFGGLVRKEGFRLEEMMSRLVLISNDDSLRTEIEQYLNNSIH
jgi:STAS-like domain of unknown function (DUF4325)